MDCSNGYCKPKSAPKKYPSSYSQEKKIISHETAGQINYSRSHLESWYKTDKDFACPSIKDLKAKLHKAGYYNPKQRGSVSPDAQMNSTYVSHELIKAVLALQTGLGVYPDGKVGPATYGAWQSKGFGRASTYVGGS